jgi:arsenate reductase (glutaredoxin)
MIIYGIKNCNTVKSAIDWLKKNKIDHEFYDYKVKGITEEKLKAWSDQVGWETLVNKRGTTWRQLDEQVRSKVVNENSAIDLMKEKTSVIKRPVVEHNTKVIAVGFNEVDFEHKLSSLRK